MRKLWAGEINFYFVSPGPRRPNICYVPARIEYLFFGRLKKGRGMENGKNQIMRWDSGF